MAIAQPYMECGAAEEDPDMDNYDRRDDSDQNRHAPGSVSEEVSGAGQRFKGAVKRATGDAIDDEQVEEKGKRENEAGRDRQRRNDAV